MFKSSNNSKPRISFSLPDLNKNAQILLCSKCKSIISPSSAYVFRSNSVKSSCWCLPGDWISTDSSEFISTLKSSGTLTTSVTSDTLSLNVDGPDSKELLEASVSSILESNIASWRALAYHKYIVSDSETSSILQSSNDDALSNKLYMPKIKKIESVYFNIIHIDPEENYPYKFLMYNDHVKSNSNNNLMKQSQVYYMPLKLYGIREEVSKMEESVFSSKNMKKPLQQQVQCPASKGVCQTSPVAYDVGLNSNSSVTPMRTSANSITEIPTDVYVESRSVSKGSVRNASAKQATQPHVGSQSDASAKRTVQTHLVSQSDASAKRKLHTHVASQSPILKMDHKKASLETKLKKLQEISSKFKY